MKKRKIITALVAVFAISMSSLAFFTDRKESSMSFSTGTICLEHVDTQHDLTNMAPGDERDIKFTYKNNGEIAVDTRITYVVSHTNLDKTLDKIATLTDGDDVLILDSDVNMMTVPGPTLKGSHENVGVELLDRTIAFKLLEEVPNEAQNMNITIDVIIEAKQHRNGSSWNEINKKTISVSGSKVEVVEESPCNFVEENYGFAFEYFEHKDGELAVTSLSFNFDQFVEEGLIADSFRLHPIVPSEYEGKKITAIWHGAFAGSPIESIKLPDTIEFMGSSAFGYTSNLKHIDMPDSVVETDNVTFARSGLESIKLSKNLKTISYGMFDGSNLKSIVIPDSVITIDKNAFNKTENLESIKFGSSVKEINSSAFAFSNISEITLPNSLTYIGEAAFNSTKLEFIEIPASVKEIDSYAFGSIETIKAVKFNEGLEIIGEGAFLENSITEVKLPHSVKKVGDDAFSLNELVKIELGSVEEVGEGAFAGGKDGNIGRIKQLIIPETLTEIKSYAFTSYLIDELVIPDTVRYIEYSGFYSPYEGDNPQIVYVNLLDGDSWPNSVRGHEFQSNLIHKPLSEFKK